MAAFFAGQIVLGAGQDVYRVVDGKEHLVYSDNLVFSEKTILVQMAYVKRLPDDEDGSLGFIKYMKPEPINVSEVEERLNKTEGAEVLATMVREQEGVWDTDLEELCQ